MSMPLCVQGTEPLAVSELRKILQSFKNVRVVVEGTNRPCDGCTDGPCPILLAMRPHPPAVLGAALNAPPGTQLPGESWRQGITKDSFDALETVCFEALRPGASLDERTMRWRLHRASP